MFPQISKKYQVGRNEFVLNFVSKWICHSADIGNIGVVNIQAFEIKRFSVALSLRSAHNSITGDERSSSPSTSKTHKNVNEINEIVAENYKLIVGELTEN